MSQSQKPMPTRPNTTYATAEPASGSHAADDTEAVLDEIDALLAEEDDFLLRYQQKGGE